MVDDGAEELRHATEVAVDDHRRQSGGRGHRACLDRRRAFLGKQPDGRQHEPLRHGHKTFLRMNRSGAIFVAALNGSALGLGAEFAWAHDLRVMADGDHFIGQPEILLGIIGSPSHSRA